MRRLIASAFSAQAAARMRPRLAELANVLFEGLAGQEVVDIVTDHAAPIAGRALAEVLGVPAQDHERFQQLTNAVINKIQAATLPTS
ncbi:hypothetical protein [Lentzea sp. NPDC004782]|uniref:hypothetical protein n=1 Tax=Lentzea sp. NPDC004782 TaxID=3154458 RepID=UPI0033A05231